MFRSVHRNHRPHQSSLHPADCYCTCLLYTSKKNKDLIDKYKVKISIMVPQGGEVGIKPENGYRSISTPQIVPPGQVDSFSYLNIGFFDTEAEAKGLISYVSCKFVRFLLRSTYSSVHVSKDNFRFVPLVDFKKTWTDEKLYEYYELSPEQITLIEDTMRPMVLEGEMCIRDSPKGYNYLGQSKDAFTKSEKYRIFVTYRDLLKTQRR